MRDLVSSWVIPLGSSSSYTPVHGGGLSGAPRPGGQIYLASGLHLPKQTQSWGCNGHCQPGGLFLCPEHQTFLLLKRLTLFSEAVSSPSHAGQGAQVALVQSDLGAQGTP